MLTVRCPTCNRLLKLPDDLDGELVQCPACRAPFPASGPLPAPSAAPPSRGPSRSSAPGRPSTGEPSAFDFGDDDPRHSTKVRVWVRTAASWLTSTLIF